MQVLVEGLQEQSRLRMMDVLWRFIGQPRGCRHWRRGQKFNKEDFPQAEVRERAEELLTL